MKSKGLEIALARRGVRWIPTDSVKTGPVSLLPTSRPNLGFQVLEVRKTVEPPDSKAPQPI